MESTSTKTELELEEEKRIQKAKSSRRIFYLFIVIDALLGAVVLYEIVKIVIAFFESA
ncbi:MAG: hypothetical protein WC282_01725 [Bacilli bacterium]|jgi:hypothetical protein